MKPLKVAFLWHMHQPNYEYKDKYLLPWTRFHAIKDYLDFPSLLYKYPKVKFTFNYVPVLMDQLENLVSGKIRDEIYDLSLLDPKEMSERQKTQIIDNFFIANYENMIEPYPYYDKLHDKVKSNNQLCDQEILDLQVWYNLCWTGIITKGNVFYERLIHKQSNFTIEERNLLLRKQLKHIAQIQNNLKNLIELGQLEMSYSPYNHPILPLLCNVETAKETIPELDLKDLQFKWEEDAGAQIKMSLDKFQNDLGIKQKGMWASEGSLSNAVLEKMIENGISWTASDETMLQNSDPKHKHLEKYFPRKYETEKGDISLFFRDHKLSDKIGFTYTNWNGQRASDDLFFDLHNIRNQIIDNYGEFALDHACVSIILDGENCWEFYDKLGIEFRNKLMKRLNDDEYFQAVTFTEAAEKNNFLLPLTNIKAGSWINGNFEIWIGEKIHIKAWKVLSEIRQKIEDNKSKLNKKQLSSAMEYIYRAESSDWFWWYFSRHWAPNKADFDLLFRYNLKKALEAADLKIPDNLNHPIWSEKELQEMRRITGRTAQTMHQVSG